MLAVAARGRSNEITHAAVLVLALGTSSCLFAPNRISTETVTETAAQPAVEDAHLSSTTGLSNLEAGETFRDCATCPEMVVVPGGAFWLGSPPDEEARIDNEGPQQNVSIASFAVGKYEVTHAQYAAFVAATRRPDPDFLASCSWREPLFTPTDDHPVTCVSWEDTKAYLAWLNGELGLAGRPDRYRLLSEAEWEYAARGKTAGTRSEPAYWWGASPSRDHANFYGVSGRDRWEHAAPVGRFEPNPFGLHDMNGNVTEWVEDCWHQSYEGVPTDGSPWTTDCDTHLRGIRGRGAGGDWPTNRTAKRGGGGLDTRAGGFRVARSVSPD